MAGDGSKSKGKLPAKLLKKFAKTEPAEPVDDGGRSGDPPAPQRGTPEAGRTVAAAGQVAAHGASFAFPYAQYLQGTPITLPAGSTIFRPERAVGISLAVLRMDDYGEPHAYKGIDGKEEIHPDSWQWFFWAGKEPLPGDNRHMWHNWQTNEKRLLAEPPELPPPLQPSDLGRYEGEDSRWYPEGSCEPEVDHEFRALPKKWCETNHVVKGKVSKTTTPSAAELAHPHGGPSFDETRRVNDRVACAQPSQKDQDGENSKLIPSDTLRHGAFVFPNVATSSVRRRALLIACTYNNTANFEGKRLHGTPKGAKAIYKMLRKKLFKPEDIVVLTDAKEHPAYQRMHYDGVYFEESNLLNISKMMCHFVSGLSSTPDNVANSLFFYATGHGHQYREVDKVEAPQVGDERRKRVLLQWHGEAARKSGDIDAYLKAQKKLAKQVEDLKNAEDTFNQSKLNHECDNMDEGFLTSDFMEHHEAGDAITHSGVLLDDYINECLVLAVQRLSNTQLVMVMDCCNAGTIADLPFDLRGVKKENGEKSYDDNFWATSGTMRRLEETYGPPMPWICGKGVVYSFAAAKDGGIASENFSSWISESAASGAGNLTTAFVEGVLRDRCPETGEPVSAKSDRTDPETGEPVSAKSDRTDPETGEPVSAKSDRTDLAPPAASVSLKELFVSIQKATEKSNTDFEDFLRTPKPEEEAPFMKEDGSPWNEYWKDPQFHKVYRYLYR